MTISDFGNNSFVTHKTGLIERIEDEPDIRPLLEIGTKKKTVYRCQFCGDWTDGITSFGGYICCKVCKERPDVLLRILRRNGVHKIEQELFGNE